MTGWRYIAERRNGDGTSTFLDFDVPLRDAQVTTTISGPGGLSGTISPEVARLKDDDGRPMFEKWSTCLWAEADGQIRGGGILTESSFEDESWALDCVGFSGYAKGQPYTGAAYWVKVDPMDLARHIWYHLQGQQRGNLGVYLDGTTSPVRLGSELKEGQYSSNQNGTHTYQVGPYKLNWYTNADLGKDFDDLAKSTPFDYREAPHWSGNEIALHLELGYPSLGRRRTDLRFVVGENIFTVPSVETNVGYANEVLAIGAGDGAAQKRGRAVRNDGRLRRVVVKTDKSAKSQTAIDQIAKDTLASVTDFESVTSVVVLDHPHAPLGSWQDGDEILVQTDAGWQDIAVWCRVISTTVSPESGDAATLSLLRLED